MGGSRAAGQQGSRTCSWPASLAFTPALPALLPLTPALPLCPPTCEQVSVVIEARRLAVIFSPASGGEPDYRLELALGGEVDPGASAYSVLASKARLAVAAAAGGVGRRLSPGNAGQAPPRPATPACPRACPRRLKSS